MGLSFELKAIAIVALLVGLVFGIKAAVTAHDQRAVAAVEDGYARQALRGQEAAIAKTAEWQANQEDVVNESQRMANRARTDAGRVPDAVVRLQQRAAVAIGGGLAVHSEAASGSSATSDPAGMCADVLGRVGDLARRYAAIADERGIAGQTCERAYDALKP